ncbi:phosphoribosyltransferase-like protein [Penicillium odoratum]|uniref:phosphoribosyltransferase-like protein n=1 Tax=Penicillium odoratum TaxID=1167516 RepID=UPI0025476C33|nr:phosphoribosyltransferase-like protein [Penicillium odoratum]KAJ5771943.1 phosphoribosyltransferase-like protein [Penicillium odoratum]
MGLCLLSGSGHKELAALVSSKIGYPVGEEALHSSRFSNGETFVSIGASVRNADVFIIQTASNPVNDMLMELLIAINACKTASARRITAVMPCFPYSRQDKKDRSRAPITAKLVANMLESAGCNHIITMDLHASQIQGFFNIPVDKYLFAEKTMIEYIRRNYSTDDLVVVSPDAGGAKRAAAIADRLHVDLAIIHKERKIANQVSRMILVGNVARKNAILVDDIADTCGTLALAAQILKEQGANQCIAIVTHGFLSGPSVKVINESVLDRLVVSNTLPLPDHARSCEKIQQMDVSPTIAEAIRRTHNGES